MSRFQHDELVRARATLRATEERFRLFVEQVSDYAMFMLDPTGVVASWNAGAERIKGYRAEEIIGQHFSRFYPEEDVRSGKCPMELEVAARVGRFEDEGWRVRKDGTRFWANVIITAVHDEGGELVGFAKVTRDLTERKDAEEARVRLAAEAAARKGNERLVALLTRLQKLTASLAAAATAEDVARVLVEDGAEMLDAATSLLFRPRGERLELVASRGASDALAAALRELPVGDEAPASNAFRSRTPVWVDTADEYVSRFPRLASTAPASGSTAAFPLVLGDRVLAVVAFRFQGLRKFESEERTLMHAWAAQAAHAMDRADVYAREIDGRRRVEALGALAKALSGALTVGDVATVIADEGLKSAGADTCALFGASPDGGLELLVQRGLRPELASELARMDPDTTNPLYRAAARNEFVWVQDEAEYLEFSPNLAALGDAADRPRAFWTGPLVSEGRMIGLLGMGYREARRFATEERDFLTTFTRQCAEALERGKRVEAERTARRLAEGLQASLSTTLRSIGDAVITTDRTGAVTMMNPVAERLTAWTEDEARGRPLPEVFRIVDERSRAPSPSPVDRVLAEGVVVGLANHTVLVRRDGSEVPVDDSGAPIRRDGADIEGVVLVFRDVGDKKREESRTAFLADATAALSESLEYEATLSKVAHLAVPELADWCAVDIVDEKGRPPKRLAVAHVDPGKVALARELAERYPPDMDASSGIGRVLRTGQSELYADIPDEMLVAGTVDEEHLRIARALNLRSAMVIPLVGRDRVFGAMTFVLAESRRTYTVDDQRFAEELARRCVIAIENAGLYESEQNARRAADVANRAKDEFLAMVSHELRTPLNAIMGWAKLMSSPSFDEARRSRAVETIDRNSVAMAQLIDDLLDMSRIISGKMRLDVQQIDPVRIVESAIESIKPAAEAKGIALAPVLDTTLSSVHGDPARLQQIVWNLLSNAVKFTPKGGRVDVVVQHRGSWLEICVSDTGKGIAPEFLPHVFEPFRQEDASRTRTRGGLGLGLAITRQLVELHGGAIEAQSEGDGRGATFLVTLPISAVARVDVAKAPGQRRTEAVFERPASLRGLRILVVDDEEDARLLVKEILETCECDVTLASSVDEAIASFDADPPDVLVSDIGMPTRDGYDLIRNVRKLPPQRGGDVPAAALTAYARAEDRRRLLNAGYSMHVPKPVEPAELVAVVASLTRFVPRDRRRPTPRSSPP